MKRRVWLAGLLTPWGSATWANPSDAERARIDRLLDAVARRTDIRFVRNGKEYSSTQAADFLRGKLQWRIEKVATVQDFIEQVGTRSTASGEVYLVRLADGRTVPSAQFLAQELQRLGKH
jgi:predicted ThiF/HesA family dinucleotide-utilizing enzyme